jgi:methyl-accepting chemotaxis protein
MNIQNFTNIKGIRYQFVVPTLIITFVVMLVLGIILGTITVTGVSESMSSKGRAITAFLSKVAPSYILNYDLSALESFVTELAKNDDVAYVAFFDKQNAVLAQNTKEKVDLSKYSVYESEVVSKDNEKLGFFKIAYKRDALMWKIFWSVFSVFAGILLSLGAIGVRVYKIATQITDVLNEVSVQLLQSAAELSKTGTEIGSLSQKLSAASHETDASIQSTVANMDQITAATAETTKNAENSMRKARDSQAEAAEGQNVVLEFEQAMTDIAESNKKLENIREVVRQIESKTQMIDEIVFQTKLLSFNANIEAARAGEQGKGFGVVADEVGKLAKVSGDAAEEIGKLLNESTNRVENTIAETGTKAQAGQKISTVCADVFRKIARNIQELDMMITAIASAAKEQENGLKMTAATMNNLSEVSARNTEIAQQASDVAGFLQNQAESMRLNITRLEQIIGATAHERAMYRTVKSHNSQNKSAA